ncbi:hypothetical protein D9758_013944 [Tetrapyrgos nigripes]|uniref:Aminotransferase class I/classII large domain-containing protein n=1 Tax=Tetrapyrgos nigripes TaxID=182062 RepID=A0A8H5CIZ8_9AGAR|nr:hypothetical protein D9758_013944 [Tetrapyrgos nigripes]
MASNTIPARELPKAVDLSHHLNKLSRSRGGSPLKHLFQCLPHPSLFPYQQLDLKVYASDAKIMPGETVHSSVDISLPQYASTNQTNTLSKAIQYCSGRGSPALTSLFRDFTSKFMRPGYADWDLLLNSGSTDGWNKVVGLLCEYGDYIIVEEHTFPSSQSLWAPMGCKGVPIKMDKDGMIPEDLERVLDKWDETHPGVKRPHLLYTVPVGQNPTGATLPFERKQAIYDTCVKYDIIICEDDPYYFLQLPEYVPLHERKEDSKVVENDTDLMKTLVSPFIHIDHQGRVIRLETMSKTLGPGNRLGYFVCNSFFAERLVHATEVVSQAPCGWSQAIIEELLKHWGQDGYIRWLLGVRENYAIRRDWICDIFHEVFDVIPAGMEHIDDFLALAKGHKEDPQAIPFFSFSYPKGGMFIYVKAYLSQNPEFKALQASGEQEPDRVWTEAFWTQLIHEDKILLTPYWFYQPIVATGEEQKKEPDVAFFRMTFSYESREDMLLGIQRLAKAFKRNWQIVD